MDPAFDKLSVPVVRRIEAARQFERYSLRALRNIHDYSRAKKQRLSNHNEDLSFYFEREVDIYLQMQMAQRMRNVKRNIGRTERRIKEVEEEILRRKLFDEP